MTEIKANSRVSRFDLADRDKRRHPDRVGRDLLRSDDAGGASALRARLMKLRAEAEAATAAAEEVERKLTAIIASNVDTDASIADRIRAFFYQNPTMSFSPVELCDAVKSPVETVRKTLQRMSERGEIEHSRYGAYGVTDEFFELNGWEKERLTRNQND